MSKIRIKGLVKAMNTVRQELAAGIPHAEVTEFRQQVRDYIAATEKICRQHQITPDQLPQPSFRAYLFLKSIDLQNLPTVDRPSQPPNQSLRIKGLVSFCQELQSELDLLSRQVAAEADLSSQQEQQIIFRKIQAQVAAVDRICDHADLPPAALGPRSRRAYQWLKFLSDLDNLELHLTTLVLAQRVLQEIRQGQRAVSLQQKDFQIALYPSSYLYRRQMKGQANSFLINQGFTGAPEEVIKALMHTAVGWHSEITKRIIREYANSDDFAELVQALDLTTYELDFSTQGRAYQLEAVFERVNTAYFGRQLPRPQLTWNSTLSQRKFGHYDPAADTVMISITLDDPQVPPYVIEFVMYHELLPKALGITIINGRRYAHTPAFREREKQFLQYEKAKAYLDQLARG